MSHHDASEFIFQHLIDLPTCDCVFCSTCQKSTGKTRLFLIFNDRKRIYQRNGVKDTWDEVHDSNEYERIRQNFNCAIEQRRIPCFSL